MADRIEILMEEYDLMKYCDKEVCEKTILHISNAWEKLVGKGIRPPIEVIKKQVDTFIGYLPETLKIMAVETPQIQKMIFERLSAKIIEIGYYEAEMNKRVSYVV